MMATFIVLYGLGSMTLGFLMGGWVMYNYYTKGKGEVKPVENYTIEWRFLAYIVWVFVCGIAFNMLFLDGVWSVEHYKVLGFGALVFAPIVIAASVNKKRD